MDFYFLVMEKEQLIKELQTLQMMKEELQNAIMHIDFDSCTRESMQEAFDLVGKAESKIYQIRVILFRKYGVAMVI